MNGKCPDTLGGAKVIAYAIVGDSNRHTGKTKQIIAGELMGGASAMVIAQYEGDSSYYVFGCYSNEWQSMTDTWHEDLDDAVAQLDWEYEDLSRNLIWYMKPADLAE